MDQNLHRALSWVESDEKLLSSQKDNKVSSPATDNANGCFDCNICLDSAHEPVVTLCGHLYCWPCIYKWLHVQSFSDEMIDSEPKCPVCKAQISQSSLVPLYGRGTSPSESDSKRPQFGMAIPRRPPPSGIQTSQTSTPTAPLHHPNEPMHTNSFQSPHFLPNHYNHAISPTAGMFGGEFGSMVFARMFGPDPYGTNYSIPSNVGASRIRRQEMQLDKSLNRVSIFLFCCFILCLLLF